MKQPKISDLKIDQRSTQNMRRVMSRAGKIKITINLDAEILTKVKEIASHRGAPYQTLINRLLKESVIQQSTDSKRLLRLEKELLKIKRQLAAA